MKSRQITSIFFNVHDQERLFSINDCLNKVPKFKLNAIFSTTNTLRK